MSLPKVAVLGVGHMGRLHAQKLAQLAAEGEVELVAVCDHDAERAALVAAELGVEALADPAEFLGRVDAVCVAVPTTQHHSVSEPLLRGGIDVLVEKPIALTREEARSLIETARRCDRILQVGHIERFSSAIEGMVWLTPSNRIAGSARRLRRSSHSPSGTATTIPSPRAVALRARCSRVRCTSSRRSSHR